MVEKVKCSDVEKSNKNEQIQQLINLVPNNKKAQAKQLVSVVMEQRAIYSGPLPPAQQFSEYEAILPGSAERILRMAEKQQEHRIHIENQAISGDLRINDNGQKFGFIALLILIGVAVLFAFLGMKTWAGIICSTTIVLISGLFIGGKISIKKELKSKN